MTWYQGPEGAGAPVGRYGHTSNLVEGTKMFVFGGWNGKEYFNDLHVLDLEVMAWFRPETSGPEPSPRQGHSSILIGNNLVVHGGFKLKEDQLKTCGLNQGGTVAASYMSDIRVLDTDSFTWSRLRISGEPPEGRYGHTINISGSEILLFGGWTLNSGSRASSLHTETSGKDHCNYFMIWNTETMSWKQGKYIGNPPS
jgi:host cell factor